MKNYKKKRAPSALDNGPEANKVKIFFSRFGGGLRSAFHKPHQPSVPDNSRDANNCCYSPDDQKTSEGVTVTESNKTVNLPHSLSNMNKGNRVSSAIHILDESHRSSPQSSCTNDNLSPFHNSSAFRDELNCKLRSRPGHHLPPRITTVAKSAESSDSLVSNESPSPNQKRLYSPYPPHSTRLITTTPSSSTHESINSTSSSPSTSDLVTLQHKLAVSRPRNRRPPTRTHCCTPNNTDDKFTHFFSPSTSSCTNVLLTDNVSFSNLQLGLIKEESEIVHQINDKPHQNASTINYLATPISAVNTDELIDENSDFSKLDSSLSSINLGGCIKPTYESDSLKRVSNSYRKSDLSPSSGQNSVTPSKPPRKNIGFERIKLNSLYDSHHLSSLTSYDGGGDQQIRPRSMFIPSGFESHLSSLSQISLKTKHVNNGLTNDANNNSSKQSSESIVFIPCKGSMDNNNSNINSNNFNIVNNQTTLEATHSEMKTHVPVSMTKKPDLIDNETKRNRYSRSPSPEAVALRRKRGENSQINQPSEHRVSRVLDLVKAFEAGI
ncbi:hypothetical protein MN116_006190 [Schistosoma mekongi]|uniref:Uncharacterized protein n=1 Tax=Schistosoma mekongi TaxID=38744 RepID=A0AAE1ZBB7_SCHME|nr:hypothetical protein MN116_006190 [Schistosoma mekongi]